jgi:hypothetical protein
MAIPRRAAVRWVWSCFICPHVHILWFAPINMVWGSSQESQATESKAGGVDGTRYAHIQVSDDRNLKISGRIVS